MRHTLLTLLLLVSPALATDPCVSGVPVGKRPGPYSFLVATGPQRGQQTCYVCEQADKPTAVVFARSLSDPLGKLMQRLDTEAGKRADAGFKAWLTVLTPTADLDGLAGWSRKHALARLPVGAFEDADGPPAYALHPDADVTVVLFVRRKVTARFAFRAGELTPAGIDTVMKAVPGLFQ